MTGYTIVLKDVQEVADGTRLFVFDKPEGFAFQSGQYVALTVLHPVAQDAKGPTRSFSLASAPYEDRLAFAMRSGESAFKQTFWRMRPGDEVSITKAVGFFTLPPATDTRPVIFLVGGIGITPVWSILKQAEHEKSERYFTLLYANRFLKDATFHEGLSTLRLEHFRYVTVLSRSNDLCKAQDDERGYICESIVRKYAKDADNALYYIVGSPEFTVAMETMLDAMSVPKERRKKDPFTGLRALPEEKTGRTE